MCFAFLNFHKCSRTEVLCTCSLRNVLHANSQKGSEPEVPLTFWLPNVLRATDAYNFWSLIRPESSAPAALASLFLYTPKPQSNGTHGKHNASRRFFPFRTFWSSFFWLSTSLTLLTTVAASVHKSEVWVPNFLQECFPYWQGWWSDKHANLPTSTSYNYWC